MKISVPLLAAAAATLLRAMPAQNVTERMNVVMLVIDDTRWDSIGAAGNPVVRTPRRLA